jgi:hypothetical protein
MKLEDIVGKRTYARLKKAGFADPKKIGLLTPEELMKIAGIGPKVALKIYKAYNIPVNQKQVNRTYNKIKFKKKFKNILGKIDRTIKEPDKAIDKLENVRKETTLMSNLLTSIYNFGKPEAERKSQKEYIPIGTTLSPRDLDYERVRRNYIMEAYLDSTDDKVIIKYERYDLALNSIDWDRVTSFLGSPQDNKVIENILESIDTNITRFRENSKEGYFTIILSKNMRKIGEILREKYRREIENNKIIIVDSKKEYMEWEVLFRYHENNKFLDLINKADEYRLFFNFEAHLNDGGGMSLSDFENKNPPDFLKEIEEKKEAYVLVSRNPRVYFGIVQAIPGLYGFRKNYKTDKDNYITFPSVKSWRDYNETKDEAPVKYNNKSIRAEIITFIKAVFGYEYDIHYKDRTSPIIFTSKKFPELGIVIE